MKKIWFDEAVVRITGINKHPQAPRLLHAPAKWAGWVTKHDSINFIQKQIPRQRPSFHLLLYRNKRLVLIANNQYRMEALSHREHAH